MFHFRNKRTGVICDVPCRITGQDWEEVAKPVAEPMAEAAMENTEKAVKKNGRTVRKPK